MATLRLTSLSDDDAVDELFYMCSTGTTAIMWACIHLTSLERVQLMSTKAKLDSRKRFTADPNPTLDSMVRRAHAILPKDM